MNIYGLNGIDGAGRETQPQGTFSEGGKMVSAPFGGSYVYTAKSVLNAKDGETGCYGIRDVSGIGQKDTNDTNMLIGEGASQEDALLSVEENMSDEDCEELSAEGDILSEYTEEALSRALKRMKLWRALNAKRIEQAVETNKQQEINIEQIAARNTVDNTRAKMIVSRLLEAGIPVNDERIKDIEEALDLWKSAADINRDTGAYLINNKLQPTIENIYKAKYSGDAKRVELPQRVWDEMLPSVTNVIKEAGLEVEPAVLALAKELVESKVPLTPANLITKEKIGDINEMTEAQVLELIIDSGKNGGKALSTVLTTSFFEMENIVEDFANITDETLQRAVINAENNSLSTINLAGLRYADKQLSSRKATEKGIADTNTPLMLKTRRQLEEIRLKLTVEAGYSLARKGIYPDIAALEDIVEGLKKLENSYYAELLQETGALPTKENIEVIGQVSDSIESLKQAPAFILGTTFENRNIVLVDELVNEGVVMSSRFKQAGESYESVMTKPRSDMGDSIKKAFGHIDEMLEEMGLETNASNRRAVRILGYNHMEITETSINEMKAYDSHVNNMLEALKPHIVSRMVKEGYNPLEHTVSEVIDKCESLYDTEAAEDEQYAKYLYKLEKSRDISADEREAYINIYRALYQIEHSDGAAVGAVVHNKESITVGNLLKAVRSSKAKNIDRKINDEFGLYYREASSELLKLITPQKLQYIQKETDENIWDMSPERLKDYLNTADTEEETDILYQKEQAADVRNRFSNLRSEGELLKLLGMPDSMNMKTAMQELIQSNDFYKKLRRVAGDNENNTANSVSEDLKDGTEIFTVANTTEELDIEYNKILEASYRLLDRVYKQDVNTSIDLAMLKTLNQGLKLRGELSRHRYYEIPIELDGETGCINLTLLGGDEKGRVDINIPAENDEIHVSVKATAGNLEYLIESANHGTTGDLQTVVEAIENELTGLGFISINGSRTALQEVPDITKRDLLLETTSEMQLSTDRLYSIAKAFVTKLLPILKEGANEN